MSSLPPFVDLDCPWQTLTTAPLAGVRVLRLDRGDRRAPGNKAFKLAGILEQARAAGHSRLLSFGGAWSNHLHALAAIGAAEQYQTVGFVRGLEEGRLTPTLQEARAWGMHLVGLSRSDYRRRDEAGFCASLLAQYGPGLLIPEGGDCAAGAGGCSAIGAAIARAVPGGATVVLPVGTGTTLAGIAAGLGPAYSVLGVAALRGADDIPARVRRNLASLDCREHASWRILDDFHAGGFARVSQPLKAFLLDTPLARELPLEPVYSGKALWALATLVESARLDCRQPLVFVHTGGLQGGRGFPWLPVSVPQ